MENKINIAELLKDCPQGMELDCTLFEGLEFDGIVDNKYLPIRCRVKNPNGGYNVYNFTKYGCWIDTTFAKCVIFPKGKTTWEGFQRPFKDGDIAISDMGDIHLLQTSSSSYCAYRESWEILPKFDCTLTTNVTIVRLATEEEKQKLFEAIKDNGYKWNEATKKLEKLIEPKFKVGDRVKHISAYTSGIVVKVDDKGYHIDYPKGEGVCYINFTLEKDYELAPKKFDINTLIPFESRVLVRDYDHQCWRVSFFGYFDKFMGKFDTVRGVYIQCIPYEGNEHLLNTNKDCDEFYKNW